MDFSWKDVCEYMKTKQGYITGCNRRAAYNRFWIVCPYCGKQIHVINKKGSDEE